MTRCPRCARKHRGPRSTEELHAEGCGVLIRAHQLTVAEAPEYLRSQWMGGALELSGWCTDCVFTEILTTAPGLKKDLDQVAQVVVTQTPHETVITSTPTSDLVEREYGEAHVCKVIPMHRRIAQAARDLLELGSPKPEGTK